jgi:hypothetical protein
VIKKFIVGVLTTSVVTIGISVPALADPSCYTGCGPAPISIVGGAPSIAPGGPPANLPAPTESVPNPGGLPITGQDLEQSLGFAALLIVGGVALVRVGRRRARRDADHLGRDSKALL